MKWLQGTLVARTTIVTDFRDKLGESATTAILSATEFRMKRPGKLESQAKTQCLYNVYFNYFISISFKEILKRSKDRW